MQIKITSVTVKLTQKGVGVLDRYNSRVGFKDSVEIEHDDHITVHPSKLVDIFGSKGLLPTTKYEEVIEGYSISVCVKLNMNTLLPVVASEDFADVYNGMQIDRGIPEQYRTNLSEGHTVEIQINSLLAELDKFIRPGTTLKIPGYTITF